MVRWTKWCDREEIRELWNLRFDDSAPFVEWFFRERFSPDHSAVSLEDGHIVSSIQSYPLHVRIRNAILPCAVIAGVSTLPAYEGRGYMGRTMRFFMNGIADRGGIVLPYRPEILAMYQGFGHFPVSRTAYFHINDPTSLASDKTGVVFLNLRQDESAIHACYHRFSQRYSGIISRSLADVRLKISDYLADDACGVGVYEQDILTGYCIYFIRATLYIEEFAANSPNDANRLFTALCQMASQAGKAVTGKLPPDIFLPAKSTSFGHFKARSAEASRLLTAANRAREETNTGAEPSLSANGRASDKNKFPFPLCQILPRRPRPAVCRSAETAYFSPAPAAANASAVSFVLASAA